MPLLSQMFDRVPWLPYVLPLGVFMLISAIEPSAMGEPKSWLPFTAEHYPAIYAVKIAAVLVAIALAWPVYRQFPCAITPLGVLVGLVGGAVWIALCGADFEEKVFPLIGLGGLLGEGGRAAYNPLEALTDNPAWMYGFMTIRFTGLVLVVPIIEEFFLRGFLMRFITDSDWVKVPFGTASRVAIVVGTAFPVLSHPLTEAFAVVAWFSMVTWLMLRTRSIWDCVLAHALTNLVLGIYVVATGDWQLW